MPLPEHVRLRGRHVPPHDGASRATLPRLMTHFITMQALRATNVAEWISLRPGRTSRGALRADELGNSSCGGFLPERFAGDQHAMHDDRELTGDRDCGAFEAKPFSQLQPPFAQITFGSAPREEDCRGLVK